MAKKLTKAEIAKNPTKAINSGKMKKKSGEIIGPGKIAARLAAKVAGKKTIGKIVKGSDVAKAIKKPFSVPSNVHPKLHDKVSSTVKMVPSAAMKKSKAPFSSTSGARQARAQNTRLTQPLTKAEARANARGLKAANKPTQASKNKELAMVKKLTEANKGLKMTERSARTDAMRTVDRIYNSKLRSKSSRKIFKKKSK